MAGRRVGFDLSAPNVHTDPGGLPIHGLVIGCPCWEVLEHTTDRVRAGLNYEAWPELMAGCPFPHRLATVELSDQRMMMGAELVATGETPVPVAFGFHPYLRLPGIAREQWLLELPVTSRMILDDRMLPTGRSEPVRSRRAAGDRTFIHSTAWLIRRSSRSRVRGDVCRCASWRDTGSLRCTHHVAAASFASSR